jgi:hypothetical protein
MTTDTRYADTRYAVVTFGTSPRRTVFRDQKAAIRVAAAALGRGSCTCARVYECDTPALARSADISEVRSGERVVFHA